MSSSSVTSKVVMKRKKSSLSEIRICVLGDRDVGKSAVVVRFLTRRFIMEYESGIDNRYRQELLVENEPVIFDVLDSSCNQSLTPANIDTSFVSSIDIVLLIYSITDRSSFQYIRNLMRHFAQIKNNCNLSLIQMPLIAIVGNKCDLVHLRQVSSEEGEILCTEYSELSTLYLGEISAADQMLGSLFVDLFKWIKRQKNQHKPLTLLDRVVTGIKGGASSSSAAFSSALSPSSLSNTLSSLSNSNNNNGKSDTGNNSPVNCYSGSNSGSSLTLSSTNVCNLTSSGNSSS